MNSKLITLLLVAFVAFPLAGCDKKAEEGGEKAGEEQAAAEEAGDEEAKGEEEAKEEEAALTAEQFATKLTPTACEAIDQCKNEKIKSATSTMVMFAGGMMAMKDKELAKKLEPIGKKLKEEKRYYLNEGECNTVFGAFTQGSGFDPKALTAKVGKTIEFDAAKAQECLDNMKSIDACEKEVKLEKELKMPEIDKVMKEANLEQSLAACEAAIVGKVAEGEACEEAYECAGEDMKCSAAKDAEPKEGEEPKKTCQAKMAKAAK
ncbi:hypothetical protein FIV42_03490 [Persicimonas caeni]|jgi:hypothetical protein|uniref:Uncharacterized protein n=1 Tax=Persicimonas caeni TaxID=2292766 RepID=A0A4Y6PNI3_PERCE|nr:hypothetical protein [Persicimonas caeni]QDG49834.1 hypothetical protein FIV42_03490 [Persicimonas caeni]QED31055.1 hypothetical protein FRD00_03485 [Persicimonas caeni]